LIVAFMTCGSILARYSDCWRQWKEGTEESARAPLSSSAWESPF
jgi:hypothetical protein